MVLKLLLLMSFASLAHADPSKICHDAVDRSLEARPPTVSAPHCLPLDPACGELQKAAHSIGDIQKSALARQPRKRSLPEGCAPLVEKRCQAYSEFLARGWSEAEAWSCASSDCSKSPDDAGFAFVSCICSKALYPCKCAKTGPEAELSPLPLPVPPPPPTTVTQPK